MAAEDPCGHGTAGRLFVALDYPDLASAMGCAEALAPLGVRFKIGLELFCRVGPAGVAALGRVTGPVLADLKLHDIPNTVGRAVAAVSAMGCWGVTCHSAGGPAMLEAAVTRAGESVRIVAVTVLTSIAPAGLAALGVQRPLPEQVRSLAAMAAEAGCAGAVASAAEAAVVRAAGGPGFVVITPGIRPAGAGAGDQARVATPFDALAAGAGYLVVGRPVTAAPDPVAACRAILSEMAGAVALP